MDKAYAPDAVEPRWRARWEELGVGAADAASSRPAFVIALPPPNITGALHLGHAVQQSVQDILCRYHRMLGDEVEWCPGTDHAAIATQNAVERLLASEGTTKEALGRQGFAARVDAWYEEYGGRIFDQMRRLGFTCDWSRARFTLDPEYVRAIRTVFKALYDEGLIYRGPRIVNWCPRCGSAISDEEIDWREHHDSLVRIRYPVDGGGEVVVATVRPETMLGDTGVAVAPGDPRYAGMAGGEVVLPLTGRRVPIVEDAAVQPEFGTGALKVTPGHDPTDYEIGRRHNLAVLSVIATDGTIDTPDLPEFHGLPVGEARIAVTEALRRLGAIAGESEYVHDVGHCDRCGGVLEPLISAQWWVRMRSLAEPAIAAVEQGEIRFIPPRFTDIYLDWMGNIRDWCISRQLWLGHAIPVSTCANGHAFAWIEPPGACPECGDTRLEADPDVLDTWFSSALWPFAIFGWPEQTDDLRRFHPTSALVTARDIIFLWVARMIMTSLRFTGRIPFSDVIINATIQAPDGSRMSKSKGNGVDPLEMIDRYGADAVRAWAGAVGTSGQDMRFDENRIASYRLFANKLWNVTRLLAGRAGDGERVTPIGGVGPETLLPEDRWILSRLARTAGAVDASIAGYRFHEAMERLYETTWHDFCDEYVEMAKVRLTEATPAAARAAAAATATEGLDTVLRLLHPFMPFVTEECAQRLPDPAPSLQQRDWPRPPAWWEAAEDPEVAGVERALELTQAIRNAVQEAGVPASHRERIPVRLADSGSGLGRHDLVRIVEARARVRVDAEAGPGAGAVQVVSGPFEALLQVGGAGLDRPRLERQRDQLTRAIAGLRAKLDNPGFLAQAPGPVVEGARRELAAKERELEAVLRMLEGG